MSLKSYLMNDNIFKMENNEKKTRLIKAILITGCIYISLTTIGSIILIGTNYIDDKTYLTSAISIFSIIQICFCVCCWVSSVEYHNTLNKQPNIESQPLLGPFPSNLGYPPIVSKNQSVHIEKPYLVSYKR
jgi:hypothetical protein